MVAVPTAIVGLLGFVSVMRRNWPLAIGLSLGPVLNVAVVIIRGLAFSPRFLLFLAFPAILALVEALRLLAVWIARLTARPLWPAALQVAGAILAGAILAAPLAHYYTVQKQPYRAALARAAELSPTGVVFTADTMKQGAIYYGIEHPHGTPLVRGKTLFIVRSVAALDHARSASMGRTQIVLSSLDRVFRVGRPRLYARIRQGWTPSELLPGSIGDGGITIWSPNSAPLGSGRDLVWAGESRGDSAVVEGGNNAPDGGIVKPGELVGVRGRLVAFAEEVLAPLARKDQRRWGEVYLRGLMLDGKRKSIEPMAARLVDGDEQCLQQFVSQSPWEWEPVRARLARKLSAAVEPEAWIVDDTGFPKFGRHSAGVARQYCGALGKVGNCQIGVSINAATSVASCPLDWRLYLPGEWDDDLDRRQAAHIPEPQRHRPKWQLALEMLDEIDGWGLEPRPVLADAAYGDNAAFRLGLDDRGLGYVVQVKGVTSAYPSELQRELSDYPGRGRRPVPRYRSKPSSLRALALTAGSGEAVTVGWREGSRGELSSRFLALRVRPAGVKLRRGNHDELPLAWLVCEWPDDHEEPTKYWLSNLPTETPLERLVSLAMLRWRVEHDYRELKDGLGLDHFEGRSYRGWAPPRHPRLDRARLPHTRATPPKSPCAGLTLFAVLRELQQLVACWTGACPTCKRPLPRRTPYLHAQPIPT